MKYTVTIIFMSCLLANNVIAEQKFTPIQLNPDIIGLIDGRSFAVSGEVIGAMYKIIRDVQAIQLGKRLSSGERAGLYTFENKKHCVRSLIPIENKIFEKIKVLRTNNNRSAIDQNQLNTLENRLTVLHQLDNQIRKDFKTIIDPFMNDARNSKDPLIVLIKEDCAKRNKPHSLLLEWAHLDANEFDSFSDRVNTFSIFDEFCTDLTIFMADLIHNCKKGRAQFEKLVAQYQH